MKNKFLIVFLVISLVFVFPLQALAAEKEETPIYLNLGDSIAFGMSSRDNQSYFDKYARFLNAGESLNLGIPGLTSDELLSALTYNPDVRFAVSGADVITISIGGNNLLGPIIEGLFAQAGALETVMSEEDLAELNLLVAQMIFDLSGSYEFSDLDEKDQMEVLLFGLEYMIHAAGPIVWQGVVATIMSSISGSLQAGVTDFSTDWPQIMDVIHDLNPNAQIFALNLYNPANEEDNPALYALMEECINAINAVFSATLSSYDYILVDVNSAFKQYDKCLDFSLAYDTIGLDPHPTSIGHQRIFNLLVKAYQDNKI